MEKLFSLGLLLMPLVSCSNLSNEHHPDQMVCSDDLLPGTSSIKIENAATVEAVLISSAVAVPIKPTKQGCLAVHPSDHGEILVRDAAARHMSLRVPLQNLPLGISHMRLSPAASGHYPTFAVNCPAPELEVQDQLPLSRIRLASPWVNHALASVTISDHTRTPIRHHEFSLEGLPDVIPLDLPEGSYVVRIMNYDAFDSLQPLDEDEDEGAAGIPNWQTCRLHVKTVQP